MVGVCFVEGFSDSEFVFKVESCGFYPLQSILTDI